MTKIRIANENDIPQLEKLFLDVRRATFTWDNPDKFQIEDYKKSTEGEIVFVADHDRKILGFVSVWEHDSPPFIHHLFILPTYQRKGIGQLLIQSLVSYLPPPYRLKCITKNKQALDFYLKTGWTEFEKGVGEDGDYLLLELKSNADVKMKKSIQEGSHAF